MQHRLWGPVSTVARLGTKACPMVLIYNFISCKIKGHFPLCLALRVLGFRALISACCFSGGALIVSEVLHHSCAGSPCWCRCDVPAGTSLTYPLCCVLPVAVEIKPGRVDSSTSPCQVDLRRRYLKYQEDGGWGRPRCPLPHPFGDKIGGIFLSGHILSRSQ